ncbi:MAG: hypothetical protein H7233_16405 [Pseudorhodobacter sp.]|nr:hypothetical protein [Frankiaceae bacterium]
MSQPFRAGPRFQALPAVALTTPTGLVHHPGDLLPRAGEPDAAAYAARIGDRGVQPWSLTVHQPWIDDPDRWELVRDALLILFDEEGYPVLPVVLDLVVTSEPRWSTTVEPHGSRLLWVLDGTVTIEVDDASHLLPRRPGAFVVPEGASATVLRSPGSPPAVLLVATVSADPRLPVVALAHRVADALDAESADRSVPHTPVLVNACARSATAGERPVMEPLARARDALLGCVDDPHRIPAARLEWARRVSAAGLEPAPPPRPRRTTRSVDPDARWARRSLVVFGEDGAGGTVCAANGHAFTVHGGLVALALASLNSVDSTSLAELARAVGSSSSTAGGGSPTAASLAPLMEQLWRLRAVEELS